MGSNLASLDRLQVVRTCTAPGCISSHRTNYFSISGLAQTAVHQVDQAELVPPSYFSTPAASGLLTSFMSLSPEASTCTSNLLPLPEKRPTFAFHRRIRDDPAFSVELPSTDSARQWYQRYRAVVKAVGSSVHNLVQEWTAEWLAGTRSDLDAEVRLKDMVEEVIWGNVIWYGVGGWASRGDSGREMNADFLLYVLPLDLFVLLLTSLHKCTSRHLSYRSPQARSQGRRFIAVVPVQTRLTLIRQSPANAPNVSLRVYRMENLSREPHAPHHGLLRGH